MWKVVRFIRLMHTRLFAGLREWPSSYDCVCIRRINRTTFHMSVFLHVTLDDVISDQKIPLGRILRNFRLRMRRTYFRTGPLLVTSCQVTDFSSGHVTSGHAQWSDPPQMRFFVRTHILLTTDGRWRTTDDGRWTTSDGKSSRGLWPGELKRKAVLMKRNMQICQIEF